MDTATHTHRRRIALVLVLAAAATTFGGQRSAPAREPLVIHGANAAEERVIDWSLRRYREAGLDGMPDLEIYLHRSHESAGTGSATTSRDASTCAPRRRASRTRGSTRSTRWPTRGPRRTSTRPPWRGSWTSAGSLPGTNQSFDWKERGTEQSAEIIAWGLGEGVSPWLPDQPQDRELADLFELLTGRQPINGIV
jgi:hypothetical protein